MLEVKKCKDCGETKSINEFNKSGSKNGKAAISSRCKPCNKIYRAKFPPKPKVDTPLPEGRTCSICNEYKTKDYFGMHKGKLRSNCKACEKAYRQQNKEKIADRAKEYRAKNLDTIKAKSLAYRNNPDIKAVRAEYHRNYYLQNKERIDAKNSRWHKENHDKHLTRVRKYRLNHINEEKAYHIINKVKRNLQCRFWYANNKAKAKAMNNNRRAYEMNAEGKFTAKDVEKLLTKQEGICIYCTKPYHDKYEVDHIIPLSRGGSNWPENLQLLCRSCNASKKDKTHEEYLEYLAFKDKIETIELLTYWRL